MRECLGRDHPHELRGSLDVLGERSLVRELTSVHEARDMITDLGALHIVANSDHGPGEVTA